MTRTRILIWAYIVLTAAACKVEAGRPGRCNTDADCGSGRTCYKNFCLAPPGIECTDEGQTSACYDGPPGTADVGICKSGRHQCVGGKYSLCFEQQLPVEAPGGGEADLICNNADDDCDGITDEFPNPFCTTSRAGLCAPGRYTCFGSNPVCTSSVSPIEERCNGLDDDCDGTPDDDVTPLCYTAPTGCMQVGRAFDCRGLCKSGTSTCTGGQLRECLGEIGPAAQETCTSTQGGPGLAFDENCNGAIDEGCPCADGSTLPCYGGPPNTRDIGLCRTGTVTCTGGQYGDCDDQRSPGLETCDNDGADDDCDGELDNIPGRGSPCVDTSTVGVCREGLIECRGSALDCVRPRASEEICNDLDDNCNGQRDEGYDLYNDENNCGSCNRQCGQGFTCCGGDCVDLRVNVDYCGACESARCPEGWQCCGGVCADLESDPQHCNECFNSCGAGQACCSGQCFDTRSDETHCGGCTTGCDAGEMCCNSQCALPNQPICTGCTSACGAGETCCIPECVDLLTDRAHCGACDNAACAPGELCCNGTCVVPDEDPNCGACGVSCEAMGQRCCNGQCRPIDATACASCTDVCDPGEDCCEGVCVSLSQDPNCGGCGNDCPMNQTCCGGSCFFLTENNHCGCCAGVCGFGTSCNTSGECCLLGLCNEPSGCTGGG